MNSAIIHGLLYVSGADPDGYVSPAVPDGVVIRSLVICAEKVFPDSHYVGLPVHVRSFIFPDDWLGGFSVVEQEIAVKASEIVALDMAQQLPVMVACREGRNRSCLVAALALMRRQMGPEAAIALVREKRVLRNGKALMNPYFIQFIESGAARLALP